MTRWECKVAHDRNASRCPKTRNDRRRIVYYTIMRTIRSLSAALPAAALLMVLGRELTAQTGRASISGIVVDSVRGGPLRDAVVRLEPSGRESFTNDSGTFAFQGVPPGQYRLRVMHFMLDTLGLAVETPSFSIDSVPVSVPVAVPSPIRIITSLCPAGQLLRGPRAIFGLARDVDTDAPLTGARVTFVYTTNPLLDKVAGSAVDLSVREARPDSTGRFRICGVPAGARGRLQVERGGVTSGEVEVSDEGVLVVAGLRVSSVTAVRTATGPGGTATRVLVGNARLSGRIRDRDGSPAVGARVTVLGTNSVAVTGSRGEFTLDSLPGGTQTVEVRKLGLGAVHKTVELSSLATATIDVALTEAATLLAPITSVDRRELDLDRVGFTERQRMGAGYFYEGDRVRKTGLSFSETLGEVPSLRVVRIGDLNYRYVIRDRRDPQGCVNFIVDGNRWLSTTEGDIDNFVTPKEVEALEVYGAATVPPEFASSTKGKCTTIVVWTSARVRPKRP